MDNLKIKMICRGGDLNLQKYVCTKCWQSEKSLMLYFGLIDERMNYSDNHQPVIISLDCPELTRNEGRRRKIYIFQNDKMWIYSCFLGFTWFQSHTRQTSKISKYCCWLWIFRYGIQNGTCNRRNISQYGHWKEIKIWHSTFQGFQVWHSTVQGFQIEPNFLTLNWVTYM